MTKRPKRIGTPVKPAWQELCRSQDAWTVRELAFLCCGWNPSVTEVPDLAEYNQAVDMINRAVRVRALETIDNLAWPGTDAERMYDGVPAFKPSKATAWASRKFSGRFVYSTDGKPVDPRLRSTLHAIIAALARQAKLNLAGPEAIDVVARNLKAIGESRSSKTISTHLEAASRIETQFRK